MKKTILNSMMILGVLALAACGGSDGVSEDQLPIAMDELQITAEYLGGLEERNKALVTFQNVGSSVNMEIRVSIDGFDGIADTIGCSDPICIYEFEKGSALSIEAKSYNGSPSDLNWSGDVSCSGKSCYLDARGSKSVILTDFDA